MSDDTIQYQGGTILGDAIDRLRDELSHARARIAELEGVLHRAANVLVFSKDAEKEAMAAELRALLSPGTREGE